MSSRTTSSWRDLEHEIRTCTWYSIAVHALGATGEVYSSAQKGCAKQIQACGCVSARHCVKERTRVRAATAADWTNELMYMFHVQGQARPREMGRDRLRQL